ncbi:MAG: sn-glycerol-3-phosphate ABC transporter ATP-binding protein UgpC [Gammaproteobacteria bacterium]|jgi:lactose/L-arabinose transport system ATP-binding protein|nr:sn-glycerol-3-phosphate ABC transporter ATP-binding protein UgpC [Gammaproteobacteria bacterium]
MSSVALHKAVKKYEDIEVIHGIDLNIEPGEFCVFVGPSGCGKSTLLRMIAGLEETTSGNIIIGDRDVTQADPADRGVAMVFQTYALYPHMTVQENMGFGLKMNKVDKQEIARKVDKAAKILQLEPYLDRKPKALSGGQRQRVAIGRAIVRGPDVFLFDEPLSNLDAELRVEMRIELAHLHKELGATMIYVTHDQVEAMTMADKIVVLRAGNIEQVGSPLELYNNPVNKFVAGFIGSPGMNFLKGQIVNDQVVVPALGNMVMPTSTALKTDLTDVLVGIRPQEIDLDNQGHQLPVDIIEHLGGVAYMHLLTATGEKLVVELRGSETLYNDQQTGIKITADKVMLFDPQTEQRIN